MGRCWAMICRVGAMAEAAGDGQYADDTEAAALSWPKLGVCVRRGEAHISFVFTHGSRNRNESTQISVWSHRNLCGGERSHTFFENAHIFL